MTAGRVELVIDRLVVEGLDLAPTDADELARLVTEELRRLAGTGGAAGARSATVLETRELSSEEAGDARLLARALAERIAAAAGTGGGSGGAP